MCDPPSRVVYLLLAAGLFAELGCPQVRAPMTTGLDHDGRMPAPSASVLRQARRRVGPAPLKPLFDRLRGPAAAPGMAGVWWRGLLACAMEGTPMYIPTVRPT